MVFVMGIRFLINRAWLTRASGPLGVALAVATALLSAGCGSTPVERGDTGVLAEEMPQATEGFSDDDFALFPPASAAERLGSQASEALSDLYTYVLFGGDAAPSQARPWRRTELELLRLIDTYVTTDDRGAGEIHHHFLVPVYPGSDSLSLTERSAPELSNGPRAALAGRLERRDQQPLALRLRTAPGPFLVSRVGSPWAMATARNSAPKSDALLVADLSHMGAEYLYPVVDAYDRPISPGGGGAEFALLELRRRLASLERVLGHAAKQRWVFLFDASGTQDALRPISARGG